MKDYMDLAGKIIGYWAILCIVLLSVWYMMLRAQDSN